MGNDAIYQQIIEMREDIATLTEMVKTHLEMHKTDDAKETKRGDRSWSLWEKVIMLVLSTCVGFLSARFGMK